ncbi:type III-A CRISPR-associated protein Csm2 [Desulfohalobiaceae bacterium Ax17]|uniref:type III-A CRISPR-associated protein Csm2 n=1 Tax=Desulfovulcanus ferrireducens TaxID=2831190 RepID=UPI00207BA11B|nr:type III-A CRISPR-associated protein Csm2 [Desulfovulcanus ferrireducens]MBT8763263.1 type III-A CRISPR-associated protein Csm2 [Desulfovulcanus ferrireducens]
MLTKEDLIDKARQEADKFIRKQRNGKASNRQTETLSSSQLRKFYGEFKRLEMKLKNGLDYQKLEPLIALQVAQVNYNAARGKIPQSFRQFIENAVKDIQTEEQFMDFILFFEAVVGFYYHFAKEYGLKIN